MVSEKTRKERRGSIPSPGAETAFRGKWKFPVADGPMGLRRVHCAPGFQELGARIHPE